MTTYTGKHNETGEVVALTEEQVKAEIIDTMQHDIGTCVEYSDDEIAQGVNENDPEDYFEGADSFEGWNYEVTRHTV